MRDLTHEKIEWHEEYRKKTTIKAVQIEHPFSVVTLEGRIEGKAGDWLAEGVKGERYIIADEIFKLTYEAVDPEEGLHEVHRQIIRSLMPFYGTTEEEVLKNILISWATSAPSLTIIEEINEKYLKSCGETPTLTTKQEVEGKNETPSAIPVAPTDGFTFRDPRETPFSCDSIKPVMHGKTTYYLNDGMMRIERQGYPCVAHAYVSDVLYLYDHQKDVRKLLKNFDHNRRPIITGFLKDVPAGSLHTKEPEEKKNCREDCDNKNTNHCSFCTNLSRYEKNGMKPKTKALREMVIKMGVGAT